jgi:hypothetical protein
MFGFIMVWADMQPAEMVSRRMGSFIVNVLVITPFDLV